VVPDRFHGTELIAVGVIYLILAAWMVLRQRRQFLPLFRDGFRTPHEHLRGGPVPR
jgi:hypothetical protein